MAKYKYEIWDNGKRGLRYTILRNDGMAWVFSKNKVNCNNGVEPVFIGPIGPREKHLGKPVAYDKWPLNIRNWIDIRNTLQYKKAIEI